MDGFSFKVFKVLNTNIHKEYVGRFYNDQTLYLSYIYLYVYANFQLSSIKNLDLTKLQTLTKWVGVGLVGQDQ